MRPLAIIGGTGIDDLEGLDVLKEHCVQTPYGEPSRPIQEGRLGEHSLFFLQRHGSPGAIPPHRINYRANLWALKSMEVGAVVAINAVGGITESMRPGRLVIPHQVIDYTWGREHTFDEGQEDKLMHIDFTEPYERGLRMELLAAADSANIPHEASGVYGATQGPRLETSAEVQRMARDESCRRPWRFASHLGHDARHSAARGCSCQAATKPTTAKSLSLFASLMYWATLTWLAA